MNLKNNPLLKKIGGLALSIAVLCTSCGPAFAAAGSPDTNATRSLTIHKYRMEDITKATIEGSGQQNDTVPADAIPLPGVNFKVAKMQDSDNTKVDTSWNTHRSRWIGHDSRKRQSPHGRVPHRRTGESSGG